MRHPLLCAICIAGLAIATGCQRGTEADRTADRDESAAGQGRQTEPGEAAEGAGQAIGDAGVTAKVHAQLAADEGLRTLTGIDVTTENGVVRLSGEVPTAADRRRAEEVAMKVDGVRSVRNDLRVKPQK